ncbi:MAG: 3-dehydroquinate synthase [Betaproteobacteria bacterium]
MRTLDVALAERSYPIRIGAGLLPCAAELLADVVRQRAVIVTNATVAAHHLEPLRKGLAARGVAADVILVPDGERYKAWPTLQDIVTRLVELRAERGTVLIALGGGVVGDLTGFAAAIYQRGMPFVQIPTTLLAQVDSSVGGKTGINHALGKNLIGAFWQPRAVLIDTDCLRTLPARETNAGLAEVIKYGAIRDAAFFAWLEANLARIKAGDVDALTHAIHESCRIKAEVVGADERETGERAILNFGHTFGHAIEAAQGYGNWLHGEAVAAGMVIAARLSERVCGLPAADSRRVHDLVRAAGLPVTPPAMAIERWLELMGRDKKVENGRLRLVVLDALGRAALRDDIAPGTIAATLGER